MFVLSSGTHTALPFSHRVWNKATYLKHLYGTTLEPSTAARGVEQWISSLRDTHANRSASQDKSADPTILGTYGQRPLESSEKAEFLSSFLRTSPVILQPDLIKSSESYKAWVTQLRRCCAELQQWKRPTKENAYSRLLWPTPTATDFKASGQRCLPGSNAHPGVSLTDVACRSGRLVPMTSSDGQSCPMSSGRVLNPRFVEWLMGYPIGWASVASNSTLSEMPLSQYKQRMRLLLWSTFWKHISNKQSEKD